MMMSNWSLMPPDILVSIFELLNDEDRCHSSSTCKSWNCVSKTPCLWRKRTFIFRGYCRSYADRLRNIKDCIQSVGCHMRELNLSCPSPNLLTAYNVTKCVRILFAEMFALHKKTILQSFTLKDLDFDETWGGFRSSRAQLISSLTFFLAYQQKLKSIDMSNAFMTSPFAFRMIEALTWGRSAKTVENIHLENFFSPTVSHIRLLQSIRYFFRSLACLKRISINMSYVNDKSFLILCSRLRNPLQQVDLHVSSKNNGSTEMSVVSPKVWNEVVCICPNLKVTLNFDYWPGDFTDYLIPNMPLAELNVSGFICGACKTSYSSSINRLFGHISQKSPVYLSKVSLLLRFGHRPYYPSVHNDDLLSFWIKCPKLQIANFSHDLVSPYNGRHHGRSNKPFDTKRILKLDTHQNVRVKSMTGPRGLEYYSFYVTEC